MHCRMTLKESADDVNLGGIFIRGTTGYLLIQFLIGFKAARINTVLIEIRLNVMR